LRANAEAPISLGMRLLASLLVALALFFSPLAMSSDGGMAMAHATAVEKTGMKGHCSQTEAPDDSDPSTEQAMDCMSACSAVPPIQPMMMDGVDLPKTLPIAVKSATMAGIPPESETPPPRFS
jgi:hypothetical protein